MTPDAFRYCIRRTGFTTEPIQPASPDQDGIIGELREELANVPHAAPKGVRSEDFRSVDDVAVTVSSSRAHTVAKVMAGGAAESTQKTENATTFYEAVSPASVLRRYCFDIEGRGLELMQTLSRVENAVRLGAAEKENHPFLSKCAAGNMHARNGSHTLCVRFVMWEWQGGM